jgi:uncharacterized membrane protein YhhN
LTAALLAAIGFVAAADWWSRLRHLDRLEQWAKPAATMLVIGLAVASGATGGQVAVAVAALVCCLIGDVALLPAVDRFVVGLAAFLVGHLLFIVLFVQYGLDNAVAGGIALVLAGLLAVAVAPVIVRGARTQRNALAIPVMAYFAAISAMAVCGWATGRPWVIAGTSLFVASDAVLGWREFVRSRPWMPVTVMITYHGALVALALSLH